MKLNSTKLRKGEPGLGKDKIKKQDIYILLDDVLDTYNIGAVFRLADAVAAKKLYLCGRTETPPNHKIKKSSINTTEWVDWEYHESALALIRKLKVQNSRQRRGSPKAAKLKVIAVEQSKGSISYDKFDYKLPICIVVGNETYGVSKEVLNECDAVVELPMFGINVSLNVMVSLAIVLYEAIEKSGS